MATMDAIKFAGGEPANFLDIGTVNDPSRVVSALSIIGADPSVRAILINIFGGMARVDVIAQGIIDANKGAAFTLPVVARLAGTKLGRGRRVARSLRRHGRTRRGPGRSSEQGSRSGEAGIVR